MAEIDNNIADNALRCVALGRKNFMFPGHDSGGERAALYSLIVSAKLNGVDPQAYLRHALTRITECSINKVCDLLPWNVAAPRSPTRQNLKWRQRDIFVRKNSRKRESKRRLNRRLLSTT